MSQENTAPTDAVLAEDTFLEGDDLHEE